MRKRKDDDQEGHSLSRDGIRKDLSGHGKKPAERSALTNWRQHREGLVRTWKETNRPRRTYFLETAGGGTCQDMERNRPTEAHSLPGDGIGRNLSGHGKKPTKGSRLTFWRWQGEGLVRRWKKTDRPRHTHFLETVSGGTCQGTEGNQPREADSLSGDGRGKDLSEDGKKPTDRGALTNWRQHREGLVRTRKETDQPRHTHFLETASGGTCQDTGKNQPSEAHSHPGDGIGRDLSGHGKKPTDRGRLTLWRQHREGFVRTWKETNQPRRTHQLETVLGGTCQDTEKYRLSEAHSQTGDGIGRNLSGHGKKPTERSILTSWRQ